MPVDYKQAQATLDKYRTGKKSSDKESIEYFEKWLGVKEAASLRYGTATYYAALGIAYGQMGFIRKKLFLRQFPNRLRAALEKALELAPNDIYQAGLIRAPFRAPKSQWITARNQGQILDAAHKMIHKWTGEPAFFAEWIGYLTPSEAHDYELILSAAIDAGDEEVYQILIASVLGKHPVATLNQTAIRALLRCNRPGAWTEIEKLLLAAQREEGLRQIIFESVDEVNPRVFPKFVRLVIEHNLLRFTAVIRALYVWLPDLWTEGDAKAAAKVLGRLLEFLNSRALVPLNEPTDIYLRLWSFAFEDIDLAMRRAQDFVKNPDPAIRRITARLISSIGFSTTIPLLAIALQDEDFSVISVAVTGLSQFGAQNLKDQKLTPIFWTLAEKWPKQTEAGILDRSEVWDVVLKVSEKPLDRFAEFTQELSASGRQTLASRLDEVADVKTRRAMTLKFLGDTSASARTTALAALQRSSLTEAESPFVEDLLRRKASDLRAACIKLLGAQPAKQVLISGDRLLGSKDKLQRQAGLELLVESAEGKQDRAAREKVLAYAAANPSLDEFETHLVERVGPKPASSVVAPSIDNGFGLYSVEQLTFCSKPKPTGVQIQSGSALNLIRSLDDLIHTHRNDEAGIKPTNSIYPNAEMTTVGDMGSKYYWGRRGKFLKSRFEDLSIGEWINPWFKIQLLASENSASEDLVRAHLLLSDPDKKFEFRYGSLIRPVILALFINSPATVEPKFILDLLAQRVAEIAKNDYLEKATNWTGYQESSWRSDLIMEAAITLLREQMEEVPDQFDAGTITRFYQILRYIDEPNGLMGREEVAKLRSEQIEKIKPYVAYYNQGERRPDRRMSTPPRKSCPISVLDRAFNVGACTEADVFDQLCYPDGFDLHWGLRIASRKGATSDAMRLLVERFIDRLVELEAARGELPTPATYLLKIVSSGIHLPQVCVLLTTNVPISDRSSGSSRGAILGSLLSVSRPREGEIPELCAAAFKAAGLKENRLLELAIFAPQWAAAVEICLKWDGLSDAIWWIHAHTKDERWGIEKEIKEIWAGEISERTPLTAEDLTNGSADVAWFQSFRPKFDDKSWTRVENLAKLASTGTGHVRAKLFAQAMSGKLSPEEIMKRVVEKRTVDAVRALGLIPLQADRESDVRARYATFQEFLRTSRQFGSMRQASEKLAVTIGIENLAHTAGYPDSLRLRWALEAAEVEDLKGPGKTVEVGNTSVRLYFDPFGDPQIDCQKDGKSLKEIPAALKKVEEVKELSDRRTAIKKQAQRMRLALEQSMQRGDEFEAAEVEKLVQHPGLAPMLANLVFLNRSGDAGFLHESGRLNSKDDRLTIAHPYDLLHRGDWASWQHAIVQEERVQPFKQAFRELYTLTDKERAASTSTRYAGHQLQPRQALAILQKREWVLRYEEGLSKTLHSSRIVARLSFEENFYTPADIEGLTIDSLEFTRPGDWKPIPLTEVPPKIFSEIMRDLDLIASVASMTGIDPEASESTVEMRASVVRELALLTRLGNVTLLPNHAVVAGKLGEYTVHLGSGIVHQRTKGQLVIVAVRQPQRGRLFLPFMDDDPRTAEIASKVLLLARDEQIKDPTILSQIVSEPFQTGG